MRLKALSRTLPAKISAFSLAVLMLCCAAVSVTAIFAMLDLGIYSRSLIRVKTSIMQNSMSGTGRQLIIDAQVGHYDSLDYSAASSNAEFQVIDALSGKELWSSAGYASQALDVAAIRFSYVDWYDGYGVNHFGYADYFSAEELAAITGDAQSAYRINVVAGPSFPVRDQLRVINDLVELLYDLQYGIYSILGGTLILFIAVVSFLLCGAGRRPGREEVFKSWVTAIPFDLLTAAVSMGCIMIVLSTAEALFYSHPAMWVLAGAGVVAAACLLLGWLYTSAVRVKAGELWRNTVVWRVCRVIKRVWLFIWRGLGELVGGLPLIWKFVIGMLLLASIEFVFHVACMYEGDTLLFFWFVEWIIQGTALMFLALMLRRLQKGGRALAAGDLSYQVDTTRMIWDFKRHGEDLNNIALGLNRAVEERLKSERLKTELITNVSHDIKTPLTSIINYSDLICRENCDNEKIREYSAVLLRQSERLKKLIDDLVDASKASTGNVEVSLAPFELDVLLTQTAGEYAQRLSDCRLELITKRPEKGLRIMADGRHMWRVFDNLMNNICKYALPGTRVYLTLEEKLGQAVISFKNTSRYELDVPGDELLERFVRGDTSRSTEGSGLGLSIARSLTELQGGRLDLTVDGDLFKAVLTFNKK